MYLSRLLLNPRSRAVRRDLVDCHQMHRTVLSAFPEAPATPSGCARDAFGALYRIEPASSAAGAQLLVQSALRPDWSRLPLGYLLPAAPNRPNPAVKPVAELHHRIIVGMRLRFRLLANPTRKIDTRSGLDGRRRHGRRVELRGEEVCLGWLSRKASQCGFELAGVHVAPGVTNVAVRSSQKMTGTRLHDSTPQALTLGTVLFEGELRVLDADRFRQALLDGIGPGKAYGCGLLSVAPARS